MTYEQPEEEVQAQIGEDSNGEFVAAWFGAVLDHRDWTLAVQFMSDEMRNLHASEWAARAENTGELHGHPREAVITALVEPDPTHPCWDMYAEFEVQWYAAQFGDFMENIAIGSRPRPLGPDLEEFILVDYSKIDAPEIVDGVPRRQVDERPQPAAVHVTVRMTDFGPRIETWSPGPAFPGEL